MEKNVSREKPLPNYEVVPLRAEEITVAAAQMMNETVDPKEPKKILMENVAHICSLVSATCAMTPVDLFVFPEFSLQGVDIRLWTRDDYLRLAIELPGEETEFIGETAKKCNCYIEVAGYTRDKDWPGHYFNCSFIVSPSGAVIHHHWKARWAPQKGEYSTTVHDVLDEFVERYGWDAVWPVARTDIGNIATFVCSEGFQHETARAFAFKGAEILARSYSGNHNVRSEYTGYHAIVGDPWLAMRANCQENNVYGIYANLAQSPNIHFALGDSMIIDCYGRVIKEANTHHETVVVERIPLATYRKQHSIPLLRQEIYAPVYQEYQGKYPPNLFSKYLPKDVLDSLRYHEENARW